jgi:hypothetical protein
LTAYCSAFGDNSKHNVTVVLVHDIVTHGGGSSSSTNKTRSLSLRLRHLLVTPPLGRTLSQLLSVVLPLHGPVLVGPGDGVVELPYVGDVGLVSPADANNANIQEVQQPANSSWPVPGGFVIRGLVSAVRHWDGHLAALLYYKQCSLLSCKVVTWLVAR